MTATATEAAPTWRDAANRAGQEHRAGPQATLDRLRRAHAAQERQVQEAADQLEAAQDQRGREGAELRIRLEHQLEVERRLLREMAEDVARAQKGLYRAQAEAPGHEGQAAAPEYAAAGAEVRHALGTMAAALDRFDVVRAHERALRNRATNIVVTRGVTDARGPDVPDLHHLLGMSEGAYTRVAQAVRDARIHLIDRGIHE